MNGLLQDPAVQGGVIPFALGLALTVVLRFGGGAAQGARFAPLALGLAFLAAYWVLEGIAPFPPVASKQKIFYLAILAVAAGLALEATGASRKATVAVAIAFPLIALLWLAQRPLFGAPTLALIVKLAILYAASLLVFWRLDAASRAGHGARDDTAHTEPAAGLRAPSMLLVSAFAAGIISLFGAFIGLAQLSIATGAILGGYMLVNYLLSVRAGTAFPFGPIGVIGVGGAWLVCVYVMTLYGQSVNKGVLAGLLLGFLLDPIARRARVGRATAARVLNPLFYGAIVAIPAVIAAAAVLATAEPDSGY